MPKDSPPLVYYVQSGDRIKIGQTANFPQRMTALQAVEMVPIKVLAVELGDRAREQERHSEFAAWRLAGEWFQASPELVEHAATLRARMEIPRWRSQLTAPRPIPMRAADGTSFGVPKHWMRDPEKRVHIYALLGYADPSLGRAAG